MARDAAPPARSLLSRLTRPFRALPVPWGALVLLLLLGLSALFPIAPIRDAATLQPTDAATLSRTGWYLLLGPISAVFDTLTLLSLRQHITLGVTAIVGWLLWWALVARVRDSALVMTRRVVRTIARVGIALVLLLGTYAAAILVPRPMAALEAASPDLIAIDFHAHTKHSHDGRPDWTAEDVRRWHSKSGFDVAYITDHRTFEGAREGWANNPVNSGTATILLPAIEVVWRKEHVNVLDADRMYQGLFNETLRDIDEEALRLSSTVANAEPILIETIPGDLSEMVAARGPGTAGVRAIEIVDGAPKGLGQGRRERARIIALADSFNLALVAGSDHHGWGHAASAWTLMNLPTWRGESPEEVSRVISIVIRRGGRGATRVIERYIADTETGIALPFTVPIVAWGMLRTLSFDERIVWLAWIAAFSLLAGLRRMRRAPGER